MSTEDLLKRAASLADRLRDNETANERVLIDALRESERQLAHMTSIVEGRARSRLPAGEPLTLVESERHRAHLQDVVQGCAAAIAPLAEACGVGAIVECTEGVQCAEHGERVDALIGRVVAAAMADKRGHEAALAVIAQSRNVSPRICGAATVLDEKLKEYDAAMAERRKT